MLLLPCCSSISLPLQEGTRGVPVRFQWRCRWWRWGREGACTRCWGWSQRRRFQRLRRRKFIIPICQVTVGISPRSTTLTRRCWIQRPRPFMTCLWWVGGGRERHRLGVQVGLGFTRPVDGKLTSVGMNFQFRARHSCLGSIPFLKGFPEFSSHAFHARYSPSSLTSLGFCSCGVLSQSSSDMLFTVMLIPMLSGCSRVINDNLVCLLYLTLS